MSGKGWFKVHRKITESAIFTDPDLLKLWIYCMAKASHKEKTVMIEKQEIQLSPGQFATGRFSLHQEFNDGVAPRKKVKETTLWNWLKKLETFGNIDIKSSNKYSVVTVINWSDYQETLTTDSQQIDNGMTTDPQQIDTNKNVKNLENLKNEENKEEVEEKAFAQVVDFYTRNIGQMPPAQYDYVKDWLKTFDQDVMVLAIRCAIDNGVYKWSYVNQTLVEWERKGAKTVGDCETLILEFKRRKEESQNGTGNRFSKHKGDSGSGYGGSNRKITSLDQTSRVQEYSDEELSELI